MAKELGSGVPIGAIATKGDASKTFTPGTHGSTYAGSGENSHETDYIREAASQVPVFLINGAVSGENIYCTVCDDRKAVYDVAMSLIRRGRKRILFLTDSHSYSAQQKMAGYEQALTQIGADISRHILSGTNDFALTEEILGQDDGGIDLVFVASPNNPTGRTVDRHLLDVLLARAEEVGATVVLDECFIDFTTAGSAVAMAADHPNLLVMKAFTKIYAMAGLRLGYGICSNPDLMGRLRAAGQAWAVSTPAQVAGLAALGETGYLERTRTYVAGERERLRRGMTELGLRVVPGEANYLLFCSDYPLYQALLDCGVIIRRCQNYFGLTGGPGAMTLPDDVTRPAAGMGDYAVRPIPFWYRVAVRTHEQNDLLLAKLREVLP